MNCPLCDCAQLMPNQPLHACFVSFQNPPISARNRLLGTVHIGSAQSQIPRVTSLLCPAAIHKALRVPPNTDLQRKIRVGVHEGLDKLPRAGRSISRACTKARRRAGPRHSSAIVTGLGTSCRSVGFPFGRVEPTVHRPEKSVEPRGRCNAPAPSLANLSALLTADLPSPVMIGSLEPGV